MHVADHTARLLQCVCCQRYGTNHSGNRTRLARRTAWRHAFLAHQSHQPIHNIPYQHMVYTRTHGAHGHTQAHTQTHGGRHHAVSLSSPHFQGCRSRILPVACTCHPGPRSSDTFHQGYRCHGYTRTHHLDYHLHTTHTDTHTHTTQDSIENIHLTTNSVLLSNNPTPLTFAAASTTTVNEHLWCKVYLWVRPLSDDSNPITKSRGCPHCPAGATI